MKTMSIITGLICLAASGFSFSAAIHLWRNPVFGIVFYEGVVSNVIMGIMVLGFAHINLFLMKP